MQVTLIEAGLRGEFTVTLGDVSAKFLGCERTPTFEIAETLLQNLTLFDCIPATLPQAIILPSQCPGRFMTKQHQLESLRTTCLLSN